MRPRNARRRAERHEQARASAGDAAAVGEMEGDEGDPRSLDAETNPVNRNLFRRNMGEWVVAMDNFKKAHPALYEEELNTRADAEACFFVRQWREALELPDDDEEELDKRMNDPDWIRKRGIAHYNLAMCHDTGFVVGMSEKKPEVAYAHYLAAAELGHPEAMCCVGSSFMYGNGVAQDVDAAAEWYVRAAMEGHVDGSYDAMFNLGQCFRKGIGRPQDSAAALKWFKAAAKYRHPDAMYAVAMSHLHGYGGAERDAELAAQMLVKICDHGEHASAQLSLAKCFVMGTGVQRDEEMGLKLSVLALRDNEAARHTLDTWKEEEAKNHKQNKSAA